MTYQKKKKKLFVRKIGLNSLNSQPITAFPLMNVQASLEIYHFRAAMPIAEFLFSFQGKVELC